MTEFLKGYEAGANDMEAGRLVSERKPVHDCRYVAEAKLAEAERRIEAKDRKIVELDKALAEAELTLVEKERDKLRRLLSGDEK